MLNLKRKTAGFTLLEMVLVLVLAGILSIAVGTRFSSFNFSDGNVNNVENRLREVIVHARNRALLLRDNTSQLTVRKDGYSYTDSGSERTRTWEGAEIAGSTKLLKFDEYGRCSNCKVPLQIKIQSKTHDGESRTLIVYETGYVGRSVDDE